MTEHYNPYSNTSKIEKARNIIKTKGFFYFSKEIFCFGRNVLLDLFAPVILAMKKQEHFTFDNKQLEYFYHRYNRTWTNPRTIEIPIVMRYIEINRDKNILEVGNVLSHYVKTNWDIIDKFETGNNTINKDIVDFSSDKRYDLIVSISTFEHIGFEDDKIDNNKVLAAFENVKRHLNKNGKIVITFPLKYNPNIDKLLFENSFEFNRECYFERCKDNKYTQISQNLAKISKNKVLFVGIKVM